MRPYQISDLANVHVCWLIGHCINDQAKQRTTHASVTLRPIKPSLACATQNGDGTSHIMAALLMLQYGMILLKPTKTLCKMIKIRKNRESHGNPISPLQGLGMKLAGRVEAVSFDEGLNDVAASGTSVLICVCFHRCYFKFSHWVVLFLNIF